MTYEFEICSCEVVRTGSMSCSSSWSNVGIRLSDIAGESCSVRGSRTNDAMLTVSSQSNHTENI